MRAIGRVTFVIAKSIVHRTKLAAIRGVRVKVKPSDLLDLIRSADRALNSGSNDAEHDALYAIRENLSEIFEDSARRTAERKGATECVRSGE